MKKIFQRIITDSMEKSYTGLVERDYDIPLDSGKIISLIGVRRCGKSSIIFNMINHLRKQISAQNIIYINFEDDRLIGVQTENLDDLIEGYYEIFPEKRDEKVFVFLDEVQVVENWETFVRRIYDSLNISIVITGSSSNLLAGEIAAGLRGRTITYEIFPLSFNEYLRFKNIDVNLNSSKSISYIRNSLEQYLFNGGFPETVSRPEDLGTRILSDYADLIIYRDIVERYGVKNIDFLKRLIKYIFCNIGTLVSFTKIYNDYKSQGFRISKDTVFDYFDYFDDAYAVFTVPILRNSVREEHRNPRKIYGIDNGFKNIYDPFIDRDYSKLYENIVFLHLRKNTKEIYYIKDKHEVDFCYTENGKRKLINVSYDISSKDTLEREIQGLLEAMEYTKTTHSTLVTSEEEKDVVIENKKISILPLYKWLLLQ